MSPTFTLSIAAALALATSLAIDDKEQLDRARALLHGPTEAEVREGARACLAVDSQDSIKLLLDVLNREQPHFRDIVFEVLPDFKDAYARRLVARELWSNKKDEGVREWCAQLLGLYGDAGLAEALVDALADGHAKVRAAAARSLGQIRYKEGAKKLEKFASDKDALVRASGDGRPVVAAKATLFLQMLSGKKFSLAEQWALWWKENREAFEFGEGAASTAGGDDKATRASYHGFLVTSDHVAFVIDKSQGMTRDLSKGGTKDDAARKELEQTLDRLLGTDFSFNCWTYGDELRSFSKEPVVLDDKNARALLKWIEKEPCSGSKNIWQVLETVVTDPDIDTVYLLSSGEPEVGRYVHWNRVCDHLANLNRFHNVVVHTVVYSDSTWYREQLEHIATSTGGSFTAEQ